MFSKPADPLSPSPRPATNAGKSVLGSDLKIVGEITSTGSVEIMGEVDGTITARSVTIGPEGQVKGDVSGDAVEVKGKLDGRVKSDSFALRASAQVQADVSYSTVVIESGAQIEGRFTKAKA